MAWVEGGVGGGASTARLKKNIPDHSESLCRCGRVDDSE